MIHQIHDFAKKLHSEKLNRLNDCVYARVRYPHFVIVHVYQLNGQTFILLYCNFLFSLIKLFSIGFALGKMHRQSIANQTKQKGQLMDWHRYG